MQNMKSPKLSLLLTAGALAVSACSLSAPKFDRSDSGAGNSTVTCGSWGARAGA